jgi:hypothetical protein
MSVPFDSSPLIPTIRKPRGMIPQVVRRKRRSIAAVHIVFKSRASNTWSWNPHAMSWVQGLLSELAQNGRIGDLRVVGQEERFAEDDRRRLSPSKGRKSLSLAAWLRPGTMQRYWSLGSMRMFEEPRWIL